MYSFVRKLIFMDCRCEEDDTKTYAELFAKLDTNKDGIVDVSELREGLTAMGIKTGKGEAQKIISSGDDNKDDGLNFHEFSNYLRDHEKKLLLTFKSLDRNNDGQIDYMEIKQSLADLGLDISEENANKILQSLKLIGGRVEDVEERLRWSQMIRCGDP